jgi:hypothetical protein
MRGRRKRVKRKDGSVYRIKSVNGRWDSRKEGRNRVWIGQNDWSRHEGWTGKTVEKKKKKTSLR